MWNPASIADMMSDDLDVTEVVVLDHITAILHFHFKLIRPYLYCIPTCNDYLFILFCQ